MSRRLRAAFILPIFLSACTSFSGAPDPVITVVQAQAMLKPYPPDEVVRRIEEMPADAERTSYRNRVVAAYVTAADAKYDQFRRGLSRNNKGGNVAFDLATLGLTSVATAWKSAAEELTTAATIAAGSRASINQRLYFQQTLPAILSLMDSKRLTVRSDILEGLSEPESVYTIQDAFSDIWRYQSAASIDGAIQDIAAAAADQSRKADLDYSKAVKFCRVSNDIGGSRRAIIVAIENLKKEAARPTAAPETVKADRAKIKEVLALTGATDPQVATDEPSTQLQVSAIGAHLRTLCTESDVQQFKNAVVEKGVPVP